jgi:catechol 2,3-dioxygenase-like lactoylglutathione lyase family enzyme
MLASSPVMAFSATTHAADALAFYRDVLGLTLVADEPYAIVFDAHGTMLRIQKTREHTPAPHTLLGWQVTDLAETMRGLAARGVRFERYDFMEQDDAGVWTTPGGARIAWFKDPDGNLLSLTAF